MSATGPNSTPAKPPSSAPCSAHEVDPQYMGFDPAPQVYDQNSPGRGYVVVVYGLYLGSIMALVTAPLGVLIAHLRLGRGARWLDSHLRFQIRTFWLGLAAGVLAVLGWQGLGLLGLPPVYAWLLGYLFATLGLAWMMGRCALGIHRLTSNRAIEAPGSWLFGLGRTGD